ncbi:hypothetical protein L9F63_003652 [Diploptera punctata]|uniref:Protein quiver n=1 Tax=Diploptera punctata TaxID=6984 RepID=A0AAD7ZJT9_DIPPU|nr:hypothetical protein L9F63_003652 [Diploptera punctata]
MEVVPALNWFLITGFILTINSHMAMAVQCYICSWNPGDYKNDNHDHNDVCSAAHFDPDRVRTHDCNIGCEIVSMKDPNGEVEMYYRNCVANKKITYEYVKKNSKLNEEEVYTCDFDLCNVATMGRPSQLIMITTILIPPACWLFI